MVNEVVPDEDLEDEFEEEEGPEYVFIEPDQVYIPDEQRLFDVIGALAIVNKETDTYFLIPDNSAGGLPRWVSFNYVKVEKAKLQAVH